MTVEFTPVWNEIIAWYLFLAGLGGGAYVSSFLLKRLCPGTGKLIAIGHAIAPAVVAIGLVMLMIDAKGGLYHPVRFFMLLSNFESIMTWGVVFLSAFMVVALATLVLDLVKKPVPSWIELVGVALSLCVALYTGALLGACASYPLWNTFILPILFLCSALSAGSAAVLAVGSALSAALYRAMDKLRHFHLIAVAGEVVALITLLVVVALGSDEGLQSVSRLLSGDYAIAFWVLLVAIGLVAPTLVDAALAKRGHTSELANPAKENAEKPAKEDRKALTEVRIAVVCANVGVLVGGYCLRYLVIMAALPATIAFPWI